MQNAQQIKEDSGKREKNQLVLSYLTLRKLIGFCGLLLPIALAIYPNRPGKYYGFEPSISDYFYTSRGDILVVILSILAVFLFTYYGYNKYERILTLIAAGCALGVAFVPTKVKCDTCDFSAHTKNGGVFGNLFGESWHISFAATFLISLAIMSLVYFPKTNASSKRDEGKLTSKAKRNIVYKICGWVMISCVVILGLYFAFKPDLNKFPVIFVFETIAISAFAISWLTKGETFFPDKKRANE
jgi:uncharacterized membrane protein